MLFADDAAIATHTEQELQLQMDRLSQACKDFGLVISLPKTNIVGQGLETKPVIKIDNYVLEAVKQFTYLGSTITDNLSLDTEISKRIGKAATTLARLSTNVWRSKHLTIKTKMSVYSACVLSTLLYGSETWTTYAKQEHRLNTFHLRCLRLILNITWQDKVTNTEVLTRADLPSMYTLLRKRRLRWLGHVRRMDDGRLPKDLLYGVLETGHRNLGRPVLRYKDVCKRDLKALSIDELSWESLADDRDVWRNTLHRQLKECEDQMKDKAAEKRALRKEKERNRTTVPSSGSDSLQCGYCNRICGSRIGLYSHTRSCSNRAENTPN